MDEGFGHWLAGFIDGEGCFVVQRLRQGNAKCIFAIVLRMDDGAVLKQIQAELGVGRLVPRKSPSASRRGSYPELTWRVESKEGCLALVRFLDKYPLRAKKAKDYALWREAVLCWQDVVRGPKQGENGPVWERMESLRNELNEGRRYEAADAASVAA